MKKNKIQKSDAPKSRGDYEKQPLREKISEDLRKIYDEVLEEPVPDDFLSILKQSDSAE